MGSDFIPCILEFFKTGHLLKEINRTFITLIPKIDNLCLTSHYRPISLCSTICKTIVKILMNRMRPLLEKLVSPYQSAFILGRSIHDNILLTHEIMHKFNFCKGKTASAALKLDMEKVYNRLEWDFISKCLQELGFHSQLIQWIIKCNSSITYSLLIDGEPKGFFSPDQRYLPGRSIIIVPLYYLYKALTSTLIKEADMAKSGIRIKICPRSPKIPCLLFADDCLLFCKYNQQSSRRLKSIIDQFCVYSGQLVNFHKSVITFSKNISSTHKQTTMSIFNIPQSHSLRTYLGCLIFQGRPRRQTF